MKKNQTYKLTKTLIFEMKEDTWKKIPPEVFQNISMKSSSALNVRRRLGNSSTSVLDVKNLHFQKYSKIFK